MNKLEITAEQVEIAMMLLDMAAALQACIAELEANGLYSRATTQRGREVLERLRPILEERRGP